MMEYGKGIFGVVGKVAVEDLLGVEVRMAIIMEDINYN